jgi:UDP-glucose 4-epimerase
LGVMQKHDVKNLVFSSSATIYGNPQQLPIMETAPRSATNPYGQTKLMIEQILEDVCYTNQEWNITSLRYFNPIGAHPSGLIGEDPNGKPNNLLPYVTQVAIGKLPAVSVFGNDYKTPDGTGIRDYIHVVDLAKAHIAALEQVSHPNTYKAYNIGTGNGTSVLEMIHLVEKVSGRPIPYTISPRRPGDIESCYANPSLAQKELNWKANYSVEQACQDAWNWQRNNPYGYDS